MTKLSFDFEPSFHRAEGLEMDLSLPWRFLLTGTSCNSGLLGIANALGGRVRKQAFGFRSLVLTVPSFMVFCEA